MIKKNLTPEEEKERQEIIEEINNQLEDINFMLTTMVKVYSTEIFSLDDFTNKQLKHYLKDLRDINFILEKFREDNITDYEWDTVTGI